MAGRPGPGGGGAGPGEAPDRIRAFDLARGLAVVFMVLVHVLWHWGEVAAISSPPGTAISLLGGPPAAPVFMALMGASIAFSRHARPRDLATRGVLLIAGGYALNVARGALPATLGLSAGVITAEEIAPFTPLRLLTSVDILQLAGCSLVLIAGLRLVSPPSVAWLVAALALVVAGPLIRGLDTGSPILDAILTPVWSDAPNVFYAVVPWAAYPLVGAVIGAWLAASDDRAGLLRRLGLAGLALCAAGIALIAVTRPGFDIYTYWRHPPALALAILGFVLAWLWIIDIAVRRWPDAATFQLLERAGRRVTTLYVVHWLIVGWGVGLVGFRNLALGPVLVAMAAVVGLTWLVGTRPFTWRRAAHAGAGA